MNAPDGLSLREKLSYSCGDLAFSLIWQTFMLYLTFYYTDVFGISALAAAAMLGISRSLDAFLDPIMGVIADRTTTRWGKYRPYLLWLCVPFAVAGVMTFTTPGTMVASALEPVFGPVIRSGLDALHGGFQSLSAHTQFLQKIHLGAISTSLGNLAGMADSLRHEVSGKLIWAILTYNVLMLLFSAINIPYSAILGVLTPSPTERTSVSSVRFVGAYAGGIVISFCLLPGTKWLGNGSDAHGWHLIFGIVGIASVALFLTAFFGTRERVQPPPAQKTSVGRDLLDLLSNGPWLILLTTTIVFILFIAARGSVTVHYFKYYVGCQNFVGDQRSFETLVSWYNGTGQLAALVGVVLLPYYASWVGKKNAFISLLAVSVVSTALFFVLQPSQVGLIFGCNLLGSITGGPLSALLWAMYADTADYSEWKRGRRATGLIFSASIFAGKQGWAIGAAVALGLMSAGGFQANVTQTPESLRGLVALMSVIPAGLGAVAILIGLFYPLSERKVVRIAAELKVRRAGSHQHARA